MEFRKKEYVKTDKGLPPVMPKGLVRNIGNQSALQLVEKPAEDEVIQRKIGMEFQTVNGNNIIKIDGCEVTRDPQERPLVVNELFSVTVDGRDLEYVTAAQDMNQAVILLEAVRRIVAIHNDIMNDSQDEVKQNLREYGYQINTSGKRDAHPQATVGICLESVPQLIDRMLKKDMYGGSIPTSGATREEADFMREKIRRCHESEYIRMERMLNERSIANSSRIAGFMHLIAQYRASECIRFNNKVRKFTGIRYENLPRELQGAVDGVLGQRIEGVEKVEEALQYILSNGSRYQNLKPAIENIINRQTSGMYSKSFMPFMSRTALNSLYALLSGQEQEGVMEIIRQYGEEQVLISKGSKDLVGVLDSPIIMGDLECLARDRDLIADAGYIGTSELYSTQSPEVSQKVKEKSALAMRKFNVEDPTDIGEGMHGAIMELRALPRDVPPEDWERITGEIIDIVTELNRI